MADSITKDGVYTLGCNNYTVDVAPCKAPHSFAPPPESPGSRSQFFSPFVNSENIRASFFFKFDRPTIHAFFGGEEFTPKDMDSCCAKSNEFQKPEKFTKANTYDKSLRHAQHMRANQEIISTSITSNFDIGDTETNSMRMCYMVDSAPANANKNPFRKLAFRTEQEHPFDRATVEEQMSVEDEMQRDPSMFTSQPSFVMSSSSALLARADSEIGKGLPKAESVSVTVEPGGQLTAAEKLEELSNLPVNAYYVEFGRQKNDKEVQLSRVNLIASQCGRSSSDNRAKAGQIIKSMVSTAATSKTNFEIIDIRFMIENNKKLAVGNERVVYAEHTAAMSAAAKDIGEEIGVDIDYRGIFQQCNSNTEGAGLALNWLMGAAQYPLTARRDDPFDRFDKTMAKLDNLEFKKFTNIYTKWRHLYEHRDVSDNTIPFVVLTCMLQNFLNEHSADSDPYILLSEGCWSAKDRTMAVAAAQFMITPLIQRELEKEGGGDISRFFFDDGTFNYEDLSAEEKLLFQKHFNLNLIHIENLINSGTDTNINADVFKNLFKHVPGIQEAIFTPVSTKL